MQIKIPITTEVSGLKSNEPTADNCINCRFNYGAGDRGRTGTLFRARDFKSLRRCGIHYTGVEFCDLKNIWNFIEDW